MPEEETGELSGEEILRLNRVRNRFSRREVESFVLERMENGKMEVTRDTICSEEDFEKLVLAYDSSTRKDSPFQVKEQDTELVENGGFRYPRLIFEKKKRAQASDDSFGR